MLESNWLTEEYVRAQLETPSNLTVADDAAGGCDGVVNGEWGFHTGSERAPWWQVDLGATQPLARVVIWNRCQAPERIARFALLLSPDGTNWSTAYQHNGTVFYGFTDKKPLEIRLTNSSARFVRVQLPGVDYLHLEEVEVFGPADPAKNLALRQPARQSSLSQWSAWHGKPVIPEWAESTQRALDYCVRRIAELTREGASLTLEAGQIRQIAAQVAALPAAQVTQDHYLTARRLQRRLALANSLLDFDTILFTKRVPPSFNHMSDQYYGWWSKPGGGLYLLRGFRSDTPTAECISGAFKEPGSFLRPTLSYDGRKVMFAWCKYYPKLAAEPDKLNKANVPEDAFYHVFEMNLDGSGLRQITHGKYDDFDARYLPDGRLVFLSTRRGQWLQVGRQTAEHTLAQADAPDCYVRCGGGPERPVAVYTLHVMDADGHHLSAISPFEMFEWTPEIAHDGSILYSRWDYIDRDNMPYMGLWTISPDGANARLVYKNHTKAPHCTFEPKPVPGSHKIVFTASAHHSQTMGSLVLLDPSVSMEGPNAITRLTPEVPFPEIEGWPKTYYTSPWPLSERFHLVAWGSEGHTVPGPAGWDRWHAVQRPANGMALYLYDAAGARELLFKDPEIACVEPIPVKPRARPPVVASPQILDQGNEGCFLLTDVYRGLKNVRRGDIKSLRLVAVPPKTHPTMNSPAMGVTHDDPGKCVLGTVPVEADGSAYFRVPAGVIVFFQALDNRGIAIQTMRTVTHVQPGQTLSCAGCHEHRQTAPPSVPALAATRPPSRITVGPSGSWPFRYDQLVQPVLNTQCVGCHGPQGKDPAARKFDLTPDKSWNALIGYGQPSLQDQVWGAYRRGSSIEGDGLAGRSALLALLTGPKPHYEVKLSTEEFNRLVIWMDASAQRFGAFDAAQEEHLRQLRAAQAPLLSEHGSKAPRTTRGPG